MVNNRFGNLPAPEGNTHQKPWNVRPMETMLQKYYNFPTWQKKRYNARSTAHVTT